MADRMTPWRALPRGTLAGIGLLGLLGCCALIGPALSGHDPDAVLLSSRMSQPDAAHWFGTDQLGRDVAARLLAGLRWSIGIAGSATIIAFLIGTTAGLVAARQDSWLAGIVRQVVTLVQSLPAFVVAMSIVVIIGSGASAVVLVLGLVSWPSFARVVEAEASSLRQREYVLAARAMQMSTTRLYLRHILPGLAPSLATLFCFHFAEMLIAESALSFLGIGAELGQPTWGVMLSESRAYLLSGPWLLLAPASAIILIVIALNLSGDGLRRGQR